MRLPVAGGRILTYDSLIKIPSVNLFMQCKYKKFLIKTAQLYLKLNNLYYCKHSFTYAAVWEIQRNNLT